MNNALPFVQPSRPAFDPAPDRLLAELLALNEEMIVQLRLERLTVVGTAHFLGDLIEQHEKTAATLRAQLARKNAFPSEPAAPLTEPLKFITP